MVMRTSGARWEGDRRRGARGVAAVGRRKAGRGSLEVSGGRPRAPAPAGGTRHCAGRDLSGYRFAVTRLICLGDSFTEGMSDDLRPDGRHLGWSDRLATGLAADRSGVAHYPGHVRELRHPRQAARPGRRRAVRPGADPRPGHHHVPCRGQRRPAPGHRPGRPVRPLRLRRRAAHRHGSPCGPVHVAGPRRRIRALRRPVGAGLPRLQPQRPRGRDRARRPRSWTSSRSTS